MKNWIVLCALSLLVAAVLRVHCSDVDDLEANIHERMHISEDEVHRIGEKKKLLEEIETENMGTEEPGPDVLTKEDPNVPHEPSESDPHKTDEDVIEGDEKMTEEQIDEKLEQELGPEEGSGDIDEFESKEAKSKSEEDKKSEEEEQRRRRKRQFQTQESRMWPTKIDVFIDKGSLDSKIVPMVHEALDWFNDNTCFTLNEVRSKSQASNPYLTYSGGSWCQSYIGKIRNTEQVIEMISGCATVGTVIHETLHALGFYHEQSRSDRDTYVRIHLNNVQSNAKGNFAKSDTKNFQWPYIFGSVMAYPGKAFSTGGGKQTIAAKDQKYQRAMGFRVTGSFADARRINTAYKCIDKCSSGADCKNGGFRHTKNCNKCICPEAFTGNDCSQFQPRIDPSGSNSDCGGVEQISSSSEKRFVLKAKSGRQDKAHYCSTQFKSPAGKVIQFRMAKESGDYMACSDGCNWGYLELNPGEPTENGGRDYGLPGYRDCCTDQIERGTIKTDTNNLLATAFAKQNNAQLTIYVSAVDGNGGGTPSPTRTTLNPTSPTVGSTPRSTVTTRRTAGTQRTTATARPTRPTRETRRTTRWTSRPTWGTRRTTRWTPRPTRSYKRPGRGGTGCPPPPPGIRSKYRTAQRCEFGCRMQMRRFGYRWYHHCRHCCRVIFS